MSDLNISFIISFLVISIVFLRIMYHFLQFWVLIASTKMSKFVKKVDDTSSKSLLKLAEASRKREEAEYLKERQNIERLFKAGKITKEEATETSFKKILRAEKLAYRNKIFMPSESSGLNIEVLFYVIRNGFIFLCFFFFWFTLPANIVISKFYTLFTIFFLGSVIFISFYKLIMRYQRFWWWASWNMFFHEYRHGMKGISIKYIFFFIFFKVNIFLILIGLASYLFFFRSIRHPLGRVIRYTSESITRLIFTVFIHVFVVPITRISLRIVLFFWKKAKKKLRKRRRKKKANY